VLHGIDARADRFANPDLAPGCHGGLWSQLAPRLVASEIAAVRWTPHGSGPPDSLMVALAQRWRWTTARARIVVELTAAAVASSSAATPAAAPWVYAAAIGPAARWSIQLFAKESACHPSI
jgi:uncharacterized membrane protein YczE